jgi:hypothetical protein
METYDFHWKMFPRLPVHLTESESIRRLMRVRSWMAMAQDDALIGQCVGYVGMDGL